METGSMALPPQNEIAIAPDGLEKWVAVYDRLTVTSMAGGMRRLAVTCGSMTIYEMFLTSEQAAHLAVLLGFNGEAA
jgi:hypothetical protein